MADDFVVGDYRRQKLLANRLRQNAAAMSELQPAQATMTTSGPHGRVQVNYGGILQNMLAPWLQQRALEKADNADLVSEQLRQHDLDAALQDQPTGQMTPQQMMRLKNLGVDTDVLRLMMPKEPNDTGMMQVLAQNPRLAKLYAAQGKIAPEMADQLVSDYQEQKAREKQDKIDIAVAGRQPREGRESFDEWKAKQDYAEGLRAKRPAASGSGRGKVDPKQALDTLETNYNELSGMLADPKAKKDLFSAEQRILVPSGMSAGGGDNPSVLGTALSKVAQGKESPMAAKLRRMATAASFSEVQKLYPASNSDIKLAQSLQAGIGDSPESMAEFLRMQKKIIDKAKAGLYGDPVVPASDTQTPLGKGDIEILGYE